MYEAAQNSKLSVGAILTTAKLLYAGRPLFTAVRTLFNGPFHGYYWQKVFQMPDTEICFCYLVWVKGQIHMRGDTYDATGTRTGRWRTVRAVQDSKNCEIVYEWIGEGLTASNAIETYSGPGLIKYFPSGSGRTIEFAEGWFKPGKMHEGMILPRQSVEFYPANPTEVMAMKADNESRSLAVRLANHRWGAPSGN